MGSVRWFYDSAASGIVEYLAQELRIQPNIHYRFIRATDEPRVLVVHMVVNPSYLRRVVGMAEELSMAVGLSASQAIRITRGSGGLLALEIPKPETLWFDIGVSHLRRRGGLRVSVGVDTKRLTAMVNFSNPLTAHGLIAGLTGSGKTNAEQVLIWSLVEHNAPDEVQVVLVDVEKRGLQWSRFDGLAHLAHPVVVEPDEARRLFAWSVAEIDRRRQQGRATPRLFVVVDELRALIESDGFVEPVRRVTSLGREYGVHFIGATQYPTVDALGDNIIKRQLSVRLVGRVDSSDAAYVATGQKGTGAEKLAGAGDFLLIQPGDDTRRLTVAHLRDDDIAALPRLAEPRFLDLSEYEDLDHVQDVAKAYPRADELEPDHVAVALTSGRGINWLASELGIGSTKAGRVKAFADKMREKIEVLGYALVPVGEL
jgi:hypothetical protein